MNLKIMPLLRWRFWLVVLTGVVASMIIAVVLVRSAIDPICGEPGISGRNSISRHRRVTLSGTIQGDSKDRRSHRKGGGLHWNDGVKAIKTMTTGEVDAKFNPGEFFAALAGWTTSGFRQAQWRFRLMSRNRRTSLQSLRYAVFLPDRVYLERVVCDAADVSWQLRGRKAGFFRRGCSLHRMNAISSIGPAAGQ